MNNREIDGLLTGSAPRSIAAEPLVQARLRDVVSETRFAARAKHWRVRLLSIAVPVVLAPVVALGVTAGIDQRLIPDYTIPVTYTTDSGQFAECSIDFYNGEISWVETSFGAVDYLRTQDWSGIGQRIYNLAVERLTANDPETTMLTAHADGTESIPTTAEREWQAWSLAETRLIRDTIPQSAIGPGGHFGGNTDCTGDLH